MRRGILTHPSRSQAQLLLVQASSRRLSRWPAADTTASDTTTSEGIESHQDGISSGSIAGIVIGIGAVVILVAVVWFLLCRRRKRARVHPQELDISVESQHSRHNHSEMAEPTANMAFY